jgi:hypothetical protein
MPFTRRPQRDVAAGRPEELVEPEGVRERLLEPRRLAGAPRVDAITADTSLRLGWYFGTSPDPWLCLQSDDELRVARRTARRAVDSQVTRRVA